MYVLASHLLAFLDQLSELYLINRLIDALVDALPYILSNAAVRCFTALLGMESRTLYRLQAAFEGTQNIAHRYLFQILCQHITAAGAPDTFDQSRFFQHRHQLLQIPLGYTLPVRNACNGNRLILTVLRKVDERAQTISSFCR